MQASATILTRIQWWTGPVASVITDVFEGDGRAERQSVSGVLTAFSSGFHLQPVTLEWSLT